MLKLAKKFSAMLLCAGVLSFGTNEAEALRYFAQKPYMESSATPYGDNEKAAHYAQAEDAKIYYEVYGKGEPIVILHGGGLGSAYEMGCFIDKLKDNNQVIVISTRGHGKSEIGHKPFHLRQRAEDIKAVLDDAGIKQKVTIIGFSDGGYSGYSFATTYPAAIEKLVAIGAGEVLQSNKFFVFDLNQWRKMDADFIEQQKKLMPEPERWQEMLDMYEDMWNGAVISKALFANVKCPVLVINGENDINSPMSTAIASYNELPNAQLSIIPNTPHPCFLVNFDAVWAAMQPFLKIKFS